jgi:hypothetical protein
VSRAVLAAAAVLGELLDALDEITQTGLTAWRCSAGTARLQTGSAPSGPWLACARPLNEIKLPPEALPPDVAAVRQTTFAHPEGNEFDLVIWQQQPE